MKTVQPLPHPDLKASYSHSKRVQMHSRLEDLRVRLLQLQNRAYYRDAPEILRVAIDRSMANIVAAIKLNAE